MTPDLPALVAHYQGVLRLRDWQIEVTYISDLTDSRGNPVWGLCYPCVDAKSATIYIRDPQTPPAGETIETALAQVVETVVHELTHLHFAPFGLTSPAEVAAEEQAVWALAPAIVRARGTADEDHIARAMLALAPPRPTSRKSSAPRPAPEKRMLDPKQNREGLKILIAKDAKAALAFLEKLIVGEEDSEGADVADPSDPAPGGEGASPAAQAAAAPPPNEEEKARVVDAELGALARTALALTGKSTSLEAMVELARLLPGGGASSAPKALAAVDPHAVERKALVARLVHISVETPATAWSDATASTPAKRLVDEPIDGLRARVEVLEKSISPRSNVVPPRGTPPGTAGGRRFQTAFGEIEISAREIASAKSRKKDPAALEAFLVDYAENKAGNEHARGVRKGA